MSEFRVSHLVTQIEDVGSEVEFAIVLDHYLREMRDTPTDEKSTAEVCVEDVIAAIAPHFDYTLLPFTEGL